MPQSLVGNTVDIICTHIIYWVHGQTGRCTENINWVHGLRSGRTHELSIIGSYPVDTTRFGLHGVEIVSPDMNGAID